MTADEVARKELCLSRVDFQHIYLIRQHANISNPDENASSLWKSASSLLDVAYYDPGQTVWGDGFEAAWQCDRFGEWTPSLAYLVEKHTGGEIDAY